MTEEEKRQQKAMLLLEFQEAENNLASLREKAGRVGRDILEIGHWLGNMSPDRGPSVETNNIENKRRDAQIRANLQGYRKVFDFDGALSLMDEVERAEKHLIALSLRKSELGLK
jgi:hypothetical protein